MKTIKKRMLKKLYKSNYIMISIPKTIELMNKFNQIEKTQKTLPKELQMLMYLGAYYGCESIDVALESIKVNKHSLLNMKSMAEKSELQAAIEGHERYVKKHQNFKN